MRQIIPHRITLLEEKLQDALKREFSLSRELQRVNNMLMARKQQKSQGNDCLFITLANL